VKILDDIIHETGADEVHWNRRYEGWARDIDASIKTDLKDQGLTVESHKANLITEPWEVETKSGGYYKMMKPEHLNSLRISPLVKFRRARFGMLRRKTIIRRINF